MRRSKAQGAYNGGMADQHAPLQRRIAAVIAAVLLAPVAYILSIGPLTWLEARTGLSYDNYWIKLYCAPIEFLSQTEAFRKFLDAYLSFWE